MRKLIFRSENHHGEELVAALWEAGTAGLFEIGNEVHAYFDDDVEISALRSRPDFLSEEEAEHSTHEAISKEGWTGILAGRRFFIAPPWLHDATPPGRMRLTVHAGAAFGTGRHETTQLMIGQLEKYVRHGETVVDVGCGSGILCEAARMLGAATVIGCDIDQSAVATARDQFGLPVFAGSADALPTASAGLLLVNISARVIDALAPELKRVARPGARVILAGFTSDCVPKSFQQRQKIALGDWECWIGTRENFTVEAAVRGAGKHSANWW